MVVNGFEGDIGYSSAYLVSVLIPPFMFDWAYCKAINDQVIYVLPSQLIQLYFPQTSLINSEISSESVLVF